ncbi:MAG: hypothetical protein ACE5I7_09630 [Candidatus Binatia bacterium]
MAVVSVFASLLHSTPVIAGTCPGDLNGDSSVTVDEIITAVNAALTGCGTAAGPAAPTACPGDLNKNNVVTIDELIVIVGAALNGCPPEATPAPTRTPTPVPESCPYTFTDNTLALGVSCAYSGPFNGSETCMDNLQALIAGDGTLVAASFDSDPIVVFGGVKDSPRSARLVAYFVGNDPAARPIAGSMELQEGGRVLVVDPATTPPFNIGNGACTFERYVGTFTASLPPPPPP